jgi:hypothetical protein
MRLWLPLTLATTIANAVYPPQKDSITGMDFELRKYDEGLTVMNRAFRERNRTLLDKLVAKAEELKRRVIELDDERAPYPRETSTDMENRLRREVDKLLDAAFKMYKARWSRRQIQNALLHRPYYGSPEVIKSILNDFANTDERDLPLRESELAEDIRTRTFILRAKDKSRDEVIDSLIREEFPPSEARDAVDYHLYIGDDDQPEMNRGLRRRKKALLDKLGAKVVKFSRRAPELVADRAPTPRETPADVDCRRRRKIEKLCNAAFKMYNARWSRRQIENALLGDPYDGSPRVIASILTDLASIDERDLPLRESELAEDIMTRIFILRAEDKSRVDIIASLVREGFPRCGRISCLPWRLNNSCIQLILRRPCVPTIHIPLSL